MQLNQLEYKNKSLNGNDFDKNIESPAKLMPAIHKFLFKVFLLDYFICKAFCLIDAPAPEVCLAG